MTATYSLNFGITGNFPISFFQPNVYLSTRQNGRTSWPCSDGTVNFFFGDYRPSGSTPPVFAAMKANVAGETTLYVTENFWSAHGGIWNGNRYFCMVHAVPNQLSDTLYLASWHNTSGNRLIGMLEVPNGLYPGETIQVANLTSFVPTCSLGGSNYNGPWMDSDLNAVYQFYDSFPNDFHQFAVLYKYVNGQFEKVKEQDYGFILNGAFNPMFPNGKASGWDSGSGYYVGLHLDQGPPYIDLGFLSISTDPDIVVQWVSNGKFYPHIDGTTWPWYFDLVGYAENGIMLSTGYGGLCLFSPYQTDVYLPASQYTFANNAGVAAPLREHYRSPIFYQDRIWIANWRSSSPTGIFLWISDPIDWWIGQELIYKKSNHSLVNFHRPVSPLGSFIT